MTTGILEGIQAQLARIEAKLDAARRPTATDLPSDSIWADGGMRVSDAAEFIGVSRTVLYDLMRSGELPFSQPTRDRVVPRRALVQLLQRKQHGAADR
jgi:excisionase family DNA binding protein